MGAHVHAVEMALNPRIVYKYARTPGWTFQSWPGCSVRLIMLSARAFRRLTLWNRSPPKDSVQLLSYKHQAILFKMDSDVVAWHNYVTNPVRNNMDPRTS